MHLATVDGRKLIRAVTEVQQECNEPYADMWWWAFGFDLTIMRGRTGRRFLAEIHELGPIVVVSYKQVMAELIRTADYEGPTEIYFAHDEMIVGERRFSAEILEGRDALRPASRTDVFVSREDFRSGDSKDEGSRSSAEIELYERRRAWYLALATELVRGPDGLLDGKYVNEGRSVQRIRSLYSIEILGLDNLGPVETGVSRPKWRYPTGQAYVDLINVHEEGVLLTYDVQKLDDANVVAVTVYQMILRVLGELSNAEGDITDQAFTVFGGPHKSDETKFAIGLNATSPDLTTFLSEGWELESQTGPIAGVVGYLRPLFRYDHGHLIFYNERGGHGNSTLDGEDGFETGLPLLVRGYEKVESESHYGELVKG